MIPLVSCNNNNNNNPLAQEMPDDFSFSLVWSVFGKSSYNSETGELVKSKFEPEEELYKTKQTKKKKKKKILGLPWWCRRHPELLDLRL